MASRRAENIVTRSCVYKRLPDSLNSLKYHFLILWSTQRRYRVHRRAEFLRLIAPMHAQNDVEPSNENLVQKLVNSSNLRWCVSISAQVSPNSVPCASRGNPSVRKFTVDATSSTILSALPSSFLHASLSDWTTFLDYLQMCACVPFHASFVYARWTRACSIIKKRP